MTGRLYLLPSPLTDDPANEHGTGIATQILPPATLAVAHRLQYFLAENAKSARAFLKAAGHPTPLQSLRIVEIGHRPARDAIDAWLAPLRGGEDAAIVSEAGCPGVADPGADIVARAHAIGLIVQPLVGPSALLLALMASGLNGQAFRFVGYLPQEPAALAARVRELERASRSGETQLWIETPYRNDRMLDTLLATCAPDTRLSIATDLTAAAESVRMRRIGDWKARCADGDRPQLNRRPTVFALLA